MSRIPVIDAFNFSSQLYGYILCAIPPGHPIQGSGTLYSRSSSVKISGRIKALIIMAVVVYVLAHVVRAMLMTLIRPHALLHPPRRSSELPRPASRLKCDEAETLKHCTRC
jgi:hypothetical protein